MAWQPEHPTLYHIHFYSQMTEKTSINTEKHGLMKLRHVKNLTTSERTGRNLKHTWCHFRLKSIQPWNIMNASESKRFKHWWQEQYFWGASLAQSRCATPGNHWQADTRHRAGDVLETRWLNLMEDVDLTAFLQQSTLKTLWQILSIWIIINIIGKDVEVITDYS